MQEQMDTLDRMEALGEEVCPSTLPEGAKILNGVWVFTAKADDHGKFRKIKARMPVQGTRKQVTLAEVSKGQAYSPVLLTTTLRVLLATGIQNPAVRFWQLDIVCAYITAMARRHIWLRNTPGWGKKGYVRKVLKALYGDPESGRLFWEDHTDYHLSLGFKRVHHDQCFLILLESPSSWIRVGWHVDDGAAAQQGADLWKWYMGKMREKYDVTAGPLRHFCGTNYHIDYEEGTVFMEQEHLVHKGLRAMGLGEDFKGANSPSAGTQPSQDDTEGSNDPDVKAYNVRMSVGFIGYLQCCTRPEVSMALKVLSKFCDPAKKSRRVKEWSNHIWRYLKKTASHGITYRRVAPELHNLVQIFSDASHAADPDTRRSVSGICGKVAGNTVFWKSWFQNIVSHSSFESELMSVDKAATTGQHVKWICIAAGIEPVLPIPIFVDNEATVHVASNPVQTDRNLHIHARYFYVRDMVDCGEYMVLHLGTKDQVSDILVTYKTVGNFQRLRSLLTGCAYVADDDEGRTWQTQYL